MKRLIPLLLLAGSTFLAGCGDSNDFNDISGQQGNPGNNVPLAPVAVNDAYTTDENQGFTVNAQQGVLANDILNTTNPAAVTVTFPAATTQGGAITGPANDGSFTYTPALGFEGTDSFTYTLSNGFGTDTATVTIDVDAVVVTQGFFVDSVNGNDATGNFATGAPYATIQGAVADAPTGADIVVRPGTYPGSITLLDGQRLLGSGSDRVNAQGAVRPVLTGPVILADGNTLDFLRIAGTNGDAIDGDGQDGGTITNCEIVDILRPAPGTGGALSAEQSFGFWTVSNNVIDNAAGSAIDFGAVDNDSLTAVVNNNTITDSGFNAIAFVTEGTSQVLAQINGNELSGNGVNATVELIITDSSTFGLDLEDNSNDDVFSFFQANTGASLEIEQLSTLTQPKPGGAGNTGMVDIILTSGSSEPTEVANGTFNFDN
jgi:hypothetical protein